MSKKPKTAAISGRNAAIRVVTRPPDPVPSATRQDQPHHSGPQRETSTLKDVARVAGVSVGTVSRVINHHPRVTETMKRRVDTAIAALGFQPDPIAQSMRSGQTNSFACVVRDFTVPLLSTFVDAMQNEVDAQEFCLFVASSYHDLTREISLFNKFSRRRVDGIVIATSTETDHKLLELLEKSTTPIVLLDRKLPERLDAVLVDHRAGMRQALDYLIRLGHARIAIISGQDSVHPVQERLLGYREALQANGIAIDPDLIRLGSFGVDFGYSEAMQLLGVSNAPTAIIAGGTSLLPGVLRAVRDRRLRVPDDVSIIGSADSELALLHSPAVTAIHWEHGQLGVAAARFLLNRLRAPGHRLQRMIFPSNLIIRDSCGPAPRR